MLTPLCSYGLSSVWKSQGLASRMFCLVLLTTSIYCLFSATKIMIRLRSLRRLNPAQHLARIERSLAGFRDLLANLRQVIGSVFCLFGFVLFWNLQTIGNFADHSKTPIEYYIFQNFVFQCFLGASAFLVFLVLHLSQWLVTDCANSCAKRLKVAQES